MKQGQTIQITDTSALGGVEKSYFFSGTRLFGQKNISSSLCLTTLWKSENGWPVKYLGTYEMKISDRNHQNTSMVLFYGQLPKPREILAAKRPDSLELKNWVLRTYHQYPLILILLSILISAVIILKG